MTDAALVTQAILASGLSARQFARVVAWHNERQLRRWEAGTSDVPSDVVRMLRGFLALSARERHEYVRSGVRMSQLGKIARASTPVKAR